jgi:hypothetical protein
MSVLGKRKHEMRIVTKSSARAELREVIDAAARARETAEAAKVALDRATTMRSAADNRLAEATRDVEAAREDHGRRVTLAAREGTGDIAATELGAARVAHVTAQDNLDATNGAVATCKALLEEAEAVARAADIEVQRQADAVVMEYSMAPLLKQAQETQDRLAQIRAAILWRMQAAPMDRVERRAIHDFLNTLKSLPLGPGCEPYFLKPGEPGYWGDGHESSPVFPVPPGSEYHVCSDADRARYAAVAAPVTQAWTAYREALTRDASAEPPSEGGEL